MLTPQAQHDKFQRLHAQLNQCYCLLMRTDWRQSSVVDADFESPNDLSSPGLLRLVYCVGNCYYCGHPTLFGITFNSRGIKGMDLLVQAIDYCTKTISEQMALEGGIDHEILHRIRKEIRTVWLQHNPNPLL